MSEIRKRPAPTGIGNGAENDIQCNQYSSPAKFRKQGELTEALLAELRCGRLRVQLAQLDMDAVGIGLKYGLIDPEQAIGLLHDRDALPWMFPDGGSAA